MRTRFSAPEDRKNGANYRKYNFLGNFAHKTYIEVDNDIDLDFS